MGWAGIDSDGIGWVDRLYFLEMYNVDGLMLYFFSTLETSRTSGL